MPTNTAERFEAVLKLQSGEIIAKGTAKVLLTQKAVRFESDFVPLYPIGTPMEVVRIFQGIEIHRFWGNVFVSDKKLMKLVSVDDELLPGAERLYLRNTPFSAGFSVLPSRNGVSGLLSLLKKRSKEPQLCFSAPITRLTSDTLVFEYDIEVPLEVGQQLLLDAHPPLMLPQCIIQIDKALCFGASASYRCCFANLSETDQANLLLFLKKYHLKNSKFF